MCVCQQAAKTAKPILMKIPILKGCLPVPLFSVFDKFEFAVAMAASFYKSFRALSGILNCFDFVLKGGDAVFGYFGAVFLLKIRHYGERSMIRKKDHLFPLQYL